MLTTSSFSACENIRLHVPTFRKEDALGCVQLFQEIFNNISVLIACFTGIDDLYNSVKAYLYMTASQAGAK